MARTTPVASAPDGPGAPVRPDTPWLLGLPVVCWIALAAGAALGRRFDYNLWDNFEYFTPILNYTHGLWLRGIVPLWNPHQWVVPAVAAGLISVRWPLREITARAFCAAALAVAVLLSLAIGGHSPLYRATYGIPVWSSVRWPFKLFLMSQGALALVAALGLELWARRLAGARAVRALPVALFALAAAFAALGLGVAPGPVRVVAVALLGAAATLAALPWLDRRQARVLFAAGAFASVASITASAHDMSMKRYAEPYGRHGASELGLPTDARAARAERGAVSA